MKKIKDFLSTVKCLASTLMFYVEISWLVIKWTFKTLFGVYKRANKMKKDETIDDETYDSIIDVYIDCEAVKLNQQYENLQNRFLDRILG